MAPDVAQVGPVLATGPLTAAVVRALRELNPGLDVLDRGAYLRVSSPGKCRLTRASVEANTGKPFRLPADLEAIMPSFRGRLHITDDEVVWAAAEDAP
jgi:toluene monooxygenase system protein D